ncbi:protease complex subunit PrcB family protein [Desulfuribacillus alkaliarsenatis]|uniref:PrcB C-terminal domain-containing protein n=1 Tax=Desulfuribacillus alkaliarsenatis TaxID=766136 RepID=A0A1E5FZQ5_9FIRM|nr:protease complex subunit PrcB family protein [Desulfuribacillus alkaliarsenatis]OEF96052.1 hypothetical protein BHF68_09945 [Desulfuribacillus alkaliarsenatis]
MENKSVNIEKIDLESNDVKNSKLTKIREWYESVKEIEFEGTKIIDNELYVLISLGEKNCGGYMVEIIRAVASDNTIRIHYSLESPKEGETMIASFVYPFDLIVIKEKEQINVTEKLDNYTVEFIREDKQ